MLDLPKSYVHEEESHEAEEIEREFSHRLRVRLDMGRGYENQLKIYNYGMDTSTLFMVIIVITFIAAMGGGFSKSKDQRIAAWKGSVIILVVGTGLLVISQALFPGE